MVIDTHIFIWYALGDNQLPPHLREQMEANPSSVFVPSICLWEALMLVEKGRLKMPKGHPDRKLRQYLSESLFREAPLTAEIALLSRTLPFTHDDPADRFIAATAQALSEPLATADSRLRALPWINLAY